MHYFSRFGNVQTNARHKFFTLAAVSTIFVVLFVYERYALSAKAVFRFATDSLKLKPISSHLVNTASASSPNRIFSPSCIASEDTISINTHFFEYLSLNLRNTTYPGIDNYMQYIIARKGIKELKDIQPLRSNSSAVINDVNFNYTLNVNTCRSAVANLSMFIAITSAPINFEKRQMIRETWFRHRDMFSSQVDVVQVAFVLGLSNSSNTEKAVTLEHQTHGDILQVDMLDTYYNLSLKDTGLFNWVDKKCSTVDFILKVDDDVYVNFDDLIRVMQLIEPAKPAVYGWYSDSLPHRDGIWAISFEDWPWSNYPGYLRGPANLFTRTAVRPLLAAAQTIAYHPFDDLFVSGLCAERAGIQVFTSDKFFVIDASYAPDPCKVRQSITWLTYSSGHMYNSHASIERFYNGSAKCDQPIVNINNETISLEEYLYHSFSEIQRH